MHAPNITYGRTPKPIRAIVLGPEKVGKSTFAAGAPSPIFLPISRERGLDDIDGIGKLDPAYAWSEVVDAMNWVYSGEHDFRTFVIDSSSTLEPLIWAQACADNGVDSIEKIGGGFGKGYVVAQKYWQELMDGLDAIRDQRGMHIILTGHVVAKDVQDPETETYSAYVWDINQKYAAPALQRWADAILFANYKRANITKEKTGFGKEVKRGVGTDERRLYTQKRPHHPGGTRYSVPYELKLNWTEFASKVDLGRQGAAGEERREQPTQPKLAATA